jgi:lysophospholipase L1-like esterase
MKSKRLVSFALGALLIAGSVSCARFRHVHHHHPPTGSGPAGPEVDRAAFSNTWTTRETWLIGIGDSITAGFGSREHRSYFELLATNAPDEFAGMRGICLGAVLPKLRIANLAISGTTSAEHAEQQIPQLPGSYSNVLALVVITTGGNDLIHNYGRTPPRDQAMYGATLEQAKPWIANFDARLNSMVEELERRFPSGCEIFLADIYDPTDGQGDIQRTGLPAWADGLKILAAYNEIIHRCAEKHPHVHVVRLHDTFLGHGIHCAEAGSAHYDSRDPHYWYYVNLEDPNERGYDAIRRLFLIEIQKTLHPEK